ncbi:MAG: tetratricopeptide repeat protein [Alphaproteobacteria bacterium]|nr:tetratricopeptide repeat protein [Alphaproteobacteria bacterium SS10]
MIKILSYAIKIAIILAIGYWLIENPGTLTLDWQGYIVSADTPIVALMALVGIGAIAIIYHLYRNLLDWPSRWGIGRGIKKRSRGYEALTKGLIAVAAGDGAMAVKLSAKARKLLDDAPLTMLLSAQAAHLSGDTENARDSFRAMLDQPELAFFGIRGLLTHELRTEGRQDSTGQVNREALRLAREAFRLEPSSPWVVETLFDLEMLAEDYDRGLGLADQMRRVGLIDADTAKQRKAAIYLARSMAAEAKEHLRDARNYAEKAVKLQPSFAPAVTRLAKFHADGGKLRKARNILDRAWAQNPHPELATSWVGLSPCDDAEGKLRWMRRLCAGTTVEDKLALVPVLLENAEWEEARRLLLAALEQNGGVRAMRLLADLELKEASDTVAATAWLDQAGKATPAPTWVSVETGATQSNWTPFSKDTARFDVLAWLVPAPAGTNTISIAPPAQKAIADAASQPPTIDAPYQEVDGKGEKDGASDADEKQADDANGDAAAQPKPAA